MDADHVERAVGLSLGEKAAAMARVAAKYMIERKDIIGMG